MAEKKKKVLFMATVDSHIELFHLPYLKMFHDKGWEVHVATETGKKIPYCDKKIKLPIKRSPFKLISNHRAIKKLREVAKKEKYDIVHCHTPVGGVVARLACKKLRREGLRMIYTAHGFHFYTGAPIHYWMMFYPVEWYLAKYTDTLITINNEDYERALAKFGKRCRDIQYVPGVGVDEKNFAKKMSAKEKLALRKKLGLDKDDKVLICVGRLDKNKNQGFLIETMKGLVAKDSNYHLLLVGPDEINGKYQKLANKLGVDKNVHFLGFRNDISELMQISDVAVSASKREGLPVNLIEAAMLGLPIVATDCRGNRDVWREAGNGLLFKPRDFAGVSQAVQMFVVRDSVTRPMISVFSLKKISDAISIIYGIGQELVSIIVPVYNGEKYIKTCLESISKQLYENIEVIVVDNCSDDRTREIVRGYNESNDDRVKCIECNRRGVSFARNAGIEESSGMYVCFIDCDDEVHNNYVSSLLFAIVNYDVDLSIMHYSSKKASICRNGVISINDNDAFGAFLSNAITEEILNAPFCKMFKRKIIKKHKIHFDGRLSIGEDLVFNYYYLGFVKKLYVGKQIVYRYNKNLNSNSLTSNKYDEKRLDQLLRVNNIIASGIFGGSLIEECKYLLMKNIYSVFKTYVSVYNDYELFKKFFYKTKEKVGPVAVSGKFGLMSFIANLYNKERTFPVFLIAKVLEKRG